MSRLGPPEVDYWGGVAHQERRQRDRRREREDAERPLREALATAKRLLADFPKQRAPVASGLPIQIRESTGRLLGPLPDNQRVELREVVTKPPRRLRPVCPSRAEALLSLMEGPMWREYAPAGADLELKWEVGNTKIAANTRHCTGRDAFVITLDTSPHRTLRELTRTALHEIGHAHLGHPRPHDWLNDPKDRMTLDQMNEDTQRQLRLLEARRVAVGGTPDPLATRTYIPDQEGEADAFAERELPRWLPQL